VEATSLDDDSVVGEECHIVSGQAQGPRYDSVFPKGSIDSYENLILLCRVHHKMVDDQQETYTADTLRQTKANHEKWVSERLNDELKPKPLRLRRIGKNVPPFLSRLTTGKQVFSLVDGAAASSLDHDELDSVQEVELVGEFLQMVRDWGDLGPDLEPSDRVRIGYELGELLRELEDAGFWVFGGREIQVMEGGLGRPQDWPMAIVRVMRKTNEAIFTVDLEDLSNGNSEQAEGPHSE